MDKNQLEPGDLAIIVKSVDGLQVGRIVQCEYIDGSHTQHGIIWLVSSQSDLVSEYGAVGKKIHMPQDWLRKILGGQLDKKIIKALEVQDS